MSLKQTVLEICDRMSSKLDSPIYSSGPPNEVYYLKLIGFIRECVAEVRGAARATPDQHVPSVAASNPVVPFGPGLISDIDKIRARHDQLEQNRISRSQEVNSVRMIMCEGGEMDGTTVPIPGDMPPGARTMIAGQVYELGKDANGHDALTPLAKKLG